MKKQFAILASAILLAGTLPTANATAFSTNNVENETAAALKIKEVNSKLIQQLELNESQYVQLKALYAEYKLNLSELQETTDRTSQLESLNSEFLAEAAKILKPTQLAAYIGAAKAETVLAEKK
ncbi:hypothetical protein ACMA1I_09570 [Pontibacter sp. 13R65]|uniref:hypothetical protein n=1 Tax=Pontibacter sp. 13R65 TaxID=3127458 RepID=UPI00301C6DEF